MKDEDPGPLTRRLKGSVLADIPRPRWRVHGLAEQHLAILWGPRRGLYRPTIALHAIQRLGPVRHALAQRAIAGFVEIHGPFVGMEEKP